MSKSEITPYISSQSVRLARNAATFREISRQFEVEGQAAFLASLILVEINWERTPLTILGKLIEYEAVHEMITWDDLKARLMPDRKIYALFHKELPEEPLIFVQVAFVNGMASNIQALLTTDRDVITLEKASTAMFYSISKTKAGLENISFGNFLIKQVVAKLGAEHPHLNCFATLSPIPGFCEWLHPLLAQDNSTLMSTAERELLLQAIDNEESWHKHQKMALSLKPLLIRLCVHYLTKEKYEQKPRDSVANFHLFNGAHIERINWLADISTKGLGQSLGMMVNYHYVLENIDQNHLAFSGHGKIVASTQMPE